MPAQNDEYNRLVTRCVKSMSWFYDIIYGADILLTTAQSSELRRVLVRLGTAHQDLHDISRRRNSFMWQVTQKVNMLQHIGELSLVLSPRLAQNYIPESHIGTCCRIWKRSATGRYRRNVHKLALLKRLTAVFARLELGQV